MLSKGILFNSACAYSQSHSNVHLFKWLKEFECFTFEEVKAVWAYILENEQEIIMMIFKAGFRHVIGEFFMGEME